MSSSTQRKRRGSGRLPVSRPGAKTRRRTNAGGRTTANRTPDPPGGSDGTLPTETIDVMDHQEDGVAEVVDLTCEASEAAVVDLTNNDSVLLVDEGPRTRRVPAAESYVVSSDEDEGTITGLRTPAFTSLQTTSASRWTPGTISCPVCMDSYSEMVDSGRLVVSTKCGHVFCSQCLRDALSRSHTCPTCRKKLTPRQYHPLYI